MQVNYPNDHDFTRIAEIKHAPGQETSIDKDHARIPSELGGAPCRATVDSKKELRSWLAQGKVISNAMAICPHRGRYSPERQLRLSCYSI